MSTRRTGEPTITTWAVLIASFALSAATWVALAQLAGFTQTIGPFRLAWLMPVAVDGYVVVSLVTWMAPVPDRVARFARKNTYAAATVGVLAQSSYHALSTWTGTDGVLWRTVLAAVVGMLPPGVAALSVHMRALTRRSAQPVPAPAPQAVPVQPAPVVVDTDPLGLRTRLEDEPQPEPSGTPEPTPESVPAPVRQRPRRGLADQQVLAVLRDAEAVPRRPDGTVAVEYVQQTFGRGQKKAIELLQAVGLHRAREGENVPVDADVDVPETRELEDART